MNFNFPDPADFPENTEPVNCSDFDWLSLDDFPALVDHIRRVGRFTAEEDAIFSEQIRRIHNAFKAWIECPAPRVRPIAETVDTGRLYDFFFRDVAALRSSPQAAGIRAIDRAITRTDPPAQKIVQDHLSDYTDLSVRDVTVQVSRPGDRHHYQQFQDCVTTTKLQNLHVDPKPGVVKAIIYLSNVTEETGPFQYLEESLDWKYDDIERCFAWGNSVGNYLHTPAHRRVANCFPKRFRKNAIIGRMIPDGSELSDHILSSLTTYTDHNLIIFDPCYGFHRGGLCERGERVNLQVVLC